MGTWERATGQKATGRTRNRLYRRETIKRREEKRITRVSSQDKRVDRKLDYLGLRR